MTSTLSPADDDSDLYAAAPASPLPPPSQDEDSLRAELSSYLTSLKASSTITLPADFDARVASASLAAVSTEQPAWMTVDLNWQQDEEEKAQETSSTAWPSATAVSAAGVPDGEASWRDAAALSGAAATTPAAEDEDDAADWDAAAAASPLLSELDALSVGLRYSEEEEMRKIAELDELLQRITSTADAAAAEDDAAVSPQPVLSPTAAAAAPIKQEDDGGTEQDLTFITSISAREQQQPQLQREEEKEAITMPVTPSSPQQQQQREDDDTVTVEAAEQTAGSGFSLSREETVRLEQIDALLSALQAEEKAGKRRRFLLRLNSRQGGGWKEEQSKGEAETKDVERKTGRRSQGGRGKERKESEKKEHKLPPIPVPAASAASVSSSSSSSSSASQYVESLSSLLDDCLSTSQLQRLADIDARLSDLLPTELDAVTVLDAGQADDGEAGEAKAASPPAPSQAAAAGRQWSDEQNASLTASSLREWYEREGKLRQSSHARTDGSGTQGQRTAVAAAEEDSEDAYGWLDDGQDGEDAQLDRCNEMDGLLPDSDDEERDAVWQRMRSLPPAPDPREETEERERKEKEDEEAAVAAESMTRASAEERATAVAAGSEGVRRRVSGLIEEAERRRQWLWSGEEQAATAASDQRQSSVAVKAGVARERRVRTSDDVSRSRAALHLPSLPGRPASAEQRAAAAVLVKSSKRRTR